MVQRRKKTKKNKPKIKWGSIGAPGSDKRRKHMTSIRKMRGKKRGKK